VKRFRTVIDDAPLSFSALASAAHLADLKVSVPPLIEPGKAGAHRSPLAVELPPKVKLLHKVGLDHDAEDALERYETSLQKRYAPRGEEALCRAYGVLSSAGRRYRVGQRAARWSELSQAPSSDSRWLWDCIYPRPYESLVKEAGQEWKLPAELVYAVMRQESAFRPEVVSPAKAVGLMQLIPPTARRVAEELEMEYDPLGLFSPPVNIRMGSYYLSKVLGSFGGSVPLAAAAYNAGPSTVARWLESGKSLPVDVWVARIPYGETRGYVNRVVGNVARYAYLSGGEKAVPKLDLALPQDVVVPADLY
jgi:soluble lytic murein transglycosylase